MGSVIPILEHDIQRTYFEWVRTMAAQDGRYAYIWAVPNAGKRSSQNRIWMWQEGLARGYPDIVIDWPMGKYVGARIEAKSLKGKLSPDQVIWLKRLGKAGFAVQVCYNLDDLMSFTRAYFALRSHRTAAEPPDSQP